MYIGYVKANKRKIICEKDIGLDRAIDFLKETRFGLISDGKKEYTLKELEHVKDLRSLPGTGPGDLPTSGEPVHEDTHRELLKSLRDYSESSPKCDN
jgi:hypothetical protein